MCLEEDEDQEDAWLEEDEEDAWLEEEEGRKECGQELVWEVCHTLLETWNDVITKACELLTRGVSTDMDLWCRERWCSLQVSGWACGT